MKKRDYVDLYLPNHHRSRRGSGNVHEHIIVTEDMLGRHLTKGEVVHHEDEDRSNNSVENLYVFKDQSHHSRYHMTGVKVMEDDYWVSPPQEGSKDNPYTYKCVTCDKYFKSQGLDVKTCSSKCLGIYQRKVSRPSKEVLYELLKTESFVRVSTMYGVSDNAVRKWCVQYNIPKLSSYYKVKYRSS